MKIPGKKYLMKRNGEYLKAMAELQTGSGTYKPVFSIYKYDAAEVPAAWIAREAIKRLNNQGDQWQVIEFRRLSGDERVVMTL